MLEPIWVESHRWIELSNPKRFRCSSVSPSKAASNRFRPVAEDANGVFYQAVAPLQKHMPMYRGGVYMDKNFPDKISPYRGDASDVRLPVGIWKPLHPGHAQKFRVVFAPGQSAPKQKNSG